MSEDRHCRPLRASDAERAEVVERLGQACGQGRLTVEELAERIGAVYRTRDRDELEDLVIDLPDRPTLHRVLRRAEDLLADASWLGITRAELAALLLAPRRPPT
jgi:hypothetical protein